MNTKLTYWLLARLPRPLIVMALMVVKYTYYATVAVLFVIPVAGMSLILVDKWMGDMVLALMIWIIVFCVVASIYVFLLGAIFELFLNPLAQSLRWSYDQFDRQLPQRERKDTSE